MQWDNDANGNECGESGSKGKIPGREKQITSERKREEMFAIVTFERKINAASRGCHRPLWCVAQEGKKNEIMGAGIPFRSP